MSQLIYRRSHNQARVLRLRVEFSVSIGDLVEHVKRWENSAYSFDSDGTFNDYGLSTIDKLSRTQVMQHVKSNFRTYGDHYMIDYPEFHGDEHETWFKQRYDIDIKNRLEHLFPELVG